MNDQLEEIFQKINHQVSTLHVYRQLYDQIYGSESTIDVVNNSAKVFFAMNQSIFIDSIILSVSRLLDPATSGAFENLSLHQLMNQVKKDENSADDLIDRLDKLLESIHKHIESFKKHRNKRIAHLDRDTIQNAAAEPLPEISEKNLDKVIEYMDKFMNEILLYYNRSHRDYYIILPRRSDGKALINRLIKAQAYTRLEEDGKIEKNYWMKIHSDLP